MPAASLHTQHAPTPAGDASAVPVGETVLWQGAPQPGAYVLRYVSPALWPALLCLATAALWEYLAVTGHHLIVYPLVGPLIALPGVYGALVRPPLLWRAARRTRYLVTDRRVLMSWGARPAQRSELAGEALPPFAVQPARGGGDVVFAGPSQHLSLWGWWQLAEVRLRFVCLADTAPAERALSALEAARAVEPACWAAASVNAPRASQSGESS
jgi:hypothetical protein